MTAMPTKRKPKHQVDPVCVECRYYETDLPPAELPEGQGFCMRYPPSKDMMSQQGQDVSRPRVTHADWWCGEFKQC